MVGSIVEIRKFEDISGRTRLAIAVRSDIPLTEQIIVVFAIWGATQWVAWRLGFQAQLGRPWFELSHVPIYFPPSFFWWWFSYDAYARSIFQEGAIIAASGGFLSVAAAMLMSLLRAREADNVHTYGSARWAKPTEIQAANLLGSEGVVLGRVERNYLRHDGPEHVLCFAPTRSGKGVTERIQPPPSLDHQTNSQSEWSGMITPYARASTDSVLPTDATPAADDEDLTESEKRRQYELSSKIAPELEREVVDEFDTDRDSDEHPAVVARTIDKAMQRVARQADLDSGDGLL